MCTGKKCHASLLRYQIPSNAVHFPKVCVVITTMKQLCSVLHGDDCVTSQKRKNKCLPFQISLLHLSRDIHLSGRDEAVDEFLYGLLHAALSPYHAGICSNKALNSGLICFTVINLKIYDVGRFCGMSAAK